MKLYESKVFDSIFLKNNKALFDLHKNLVEFIQPDVCDLLKYCQYRYNYVYKLLLELENAIFTFVSLSTKPLNMIVMEWNKLPPEGFQKDTTSTRSTGLSITVLKSVCDWLKTSAVCNGIFSMNCTIKRISYLSIEKWHS